MAKNDALNNILGANGEWKVIVPAASSVQITPPASLKQADAPTDGVQTPNGGAGVGARRVVRILVATGGAAVTVYDSATVAGATAGATVFSKATAAAGDVYVLDCLLVIGLYVITGAGTQVTVIFT